MEILFMAPPIRVANALLDVARTYSDKQVFLYFNDLNTARVEELKKHLPPDERNFKIITLNEGCDGLLDTIEPQLKESSHYHYFLLYDPYNANIEWRVLVPFFRYWGRGYDQSCTDGSDSRYYKRQECYGNRKKYEHTYLEEFEKLLPYGSNQSAYEKRVAEIIDHMKGNREYYVASFPFYNRNRSLMYDLIHCTKAILRALNCTRNVHGRCLKGTVS